MRARPLITVRDVPASSRWYCAVLGCESGHGGSEYEMVMWGEALVLQLHAWDAHDHPHLGDEANASRGNGAVLWFQTDDFDDALARIREVGAIVLEGPSVNENAQHREIWLRDPDGYVVVVASAYGDVGVAR